MLHRSAGRATALHSCPWDVKHPLIPVYHVPSEAVLAPLSQPSMKCKIEFGNMPQILRREYFAEPYLLVSSKEPHPAVVLAAMRHRPRWIAREAAISNCQSVGERNKRAVVIEGGGGPALVIGHVIKILFNFSRSDSFSCAFSKTFVQPCKTWHICPKGSLGSSRVCQRIFCDLGKGQFFRTSS